MTSNFTLLGMRMGMDWVIFAELACPCLSLAVTTTAVEGSHARQRGLVAPWRSSNRSPCGRIVQMCFCVWLNTFCQSAASYDPESLVLWERDSLAGAVLALYTPSMGSLKDGYGCSKVGSPPSPCHFTPVLIRLGCFPRRQDGSR